jgi:nicotinate-nucleotide adenylyltransferase
LIPDGRRIAIFGGSFDPPHVGHLNAAEEVALRLGYDVIVFVPSYQPPHKRHLSRTPAETRYQMVCQAIAGNDRFAVSRGEIDRGGVSYTVDTVRMIREEFRPSGPIGLIIGEDLAEGFVHWREPDVIADEADLVIVRRPGITDPRWMESFPFPHSAVDNALLPISSSDIRARARSGASFRYLVGPDVYRTIIRDGLYVGGTRAGAQERWE